jgi:pyridoxamine 5'-phosphate oxidase
MTANHPAPPTPAATSPTAPTAADPIARFRYEFERARAVEPHDITAVALATVGPGGAPSVRYVLLKDADERGFVFYTNRESRKGVELESNPSAALAFFWPTLEVQVRVEGRVELVDDSESDAYFRTRPRGSQIGAWASQQSRPLPSREALERAVADLEAAYEGREIPRPPHWGGYRVVPSCIEFWYGRPNRLHDRELFVREGQGWRVERLYP